MTRFQLYNTSQALRPDRVTTARARAALHRRSCVSAQWLCVYTRPMCVVYTPDPVLKCQLRRAASLTRSFFDTHPRTPLRQG